MSLDQVVDLGGWSPVQCYHTYHVWHHMSRVTYHVWHVVCQIQGLNYLCEFILRLLNSMTNWVWNPLSSSHLKLSLKSLCNCDPGGDHWPGAWSSLSWYWPLTRGSITSASTISWALPGVCTVAGCRFLKIFQLIRKLSIFLLIRKYFQFFVKCVITFCHSGLPSCTARYHYKNKMKSSYII